jgi:hypothetical protein
MRRLASTEAASLCEIAKGKYVRGNPRAWWLDWAVPCEHFDSTSTTLSDVVSLVDAIVTCVDALTEASNAEEDSLVASLTRGGLSAELAERLVAFVPMAFARVVLEQRGARFSDDYEVRDPASGASQYCRLSEEEVYVAARRYATWAGSDDERVLRIAEHSAEMDAARKLLRPGEDASQLVFTAPVLLRLLPKKPS